jgi:hypothetical protein
MEGGQYHKASTGLIRPLAISKQATNAKRRFAEYDRRAALVGRGRVLKSRQPQLAIPVPRPYDPNWDSLTNGYGSEVVSFGEPLSHRS